MEIIYKCKMCGGTIELTDNKSTAICEYCGTQQTLPKLDNERKVNLYDRANHFRRNNEFDKARAIYENILNEDSTDAEAYWSLVLCRYGIEYVEDPNNNKRVPTVNRAQFTSVFEDENYKSALEYADINQKIIYENEADVINEIQKGILQISQKEEPFDVFICYKETDKNGRRTLDSVLSNDLYHQLTGEGFKVFFSRITLEDKLGTAYEPYIFAALNSAKVMVVIGTQQEFLNAVWVKNEWSRYLTLVKQSGGKKVLIPAYRDMDPYDLPEEFSHLQAQDMSKLGFMQDLIRGIRKIIKPEKTSQYSDQNITNNIDSLVKRTFLFLEDGKFKDAKQYAEKILDIDPENPSAYLAALMIDLECRKKEDLRNTSTIWQDNLNFEKMIRFSGSGFSNEIKAYSKTATRNIIEKNYSKLESTISKLIETKSEISSEEAKEIKYNIERYVKLALSLEETSEKTKELYYSLAEKNLENVKTVDSAEFSKYLFEILTDYKDSAEKVLKCEQKIAEIKEAERKKNLAEEVEKKTRKIAGYAVIGAVFIESVALLCLMPLFKNAYTSLDVLELFRRFTTEFFVFATCYVFSVYGYIATSLYYIKNGFNKNISILGYCLCHRIFSIGLIVVSLSGWKLEIFTISMFVLSIAFNIYTIIIAKKHNKNNIFSILLITVIASIVAVVMFTPKLEKRMGKRDYSKNQIQISGEWANIRSSTTTSSSKLGERYEYQLFDVISKNENGAYTWYEIEYEDGKTGYIADSNCDFLAISGDERASTKKQIQIVSAYANLREVPSVYSGKKIAELYEGQIYTVISVADTYEYTWYEVETKDGKRGFVADVNCKLLYN